MILATAASTGPATAYTIFAILAAAVVVLGGLVALVRSIWRVAITMRDNTTATEDLTEKLNEFIKVVDGRFEKLDVRVSSLEASRDHRA